MKKKHSKVSEAILEMAGDQYRTGLIDKDTHEKITMRLLGARALPMAKPVSGAEVRRMRQRAKMSQAAFARHLSLTPGYISQLERGTKEPKGPALVLLNVIRRNGIEVVL